MDAKDDRQRVPERNGRERENPSLDGRLRELSASVKHAWWLNPEHARHWGTGDSVAPAYGEIVPMVECRNLTQLEEFVCAISSGHPAR